MVASQELSQEELSQELHSELTQQRLAQSFVDVAFTPRGLRGTELKTLNRKKSGRWLRQSKECAISLVD